MPQHQANSFGQVIARLQRSRRFSRDIRRAGAHSVGLATSPGPVPGTATTTLDATIRPVGRSRYRRLGWAPGEPHLVRDDLGVTASPDRAATRRSLLYVAHHTDVHVCDTQAPARMVGGESFGWVNPGADSGHRPQETCTTQVLDALVQATNAVAISPVSGAPMAFCIQTGDNTDNRTTAELAWWLDVLDGGSVTPNTGAEGRYEGVQRSGWRAVWHPDRPGWDRRQAEGFPHLPGFLDGAVAPFDATGLSMPWLTVFGNHDVIFSGSFGPARGLRIDLLEPMLMDTSRNPVSATGLVRAIVHASTLGADPNRWARLSKGPGVIDVTPDPDARRVVPVDEFLSRLLATDGGIGPAGHGFTTDNLADHTTWWSRPEGDHVQVIGLDTCNHTTGDSGRMGPAQTAWLEAELARHHSRWQDREGCWIEGDGTDRLVVLASHHNSWTMGNRHEDEYDPGDPTDGDALVELVGRFPNVVLWLNGHSHEHQIVPHLTGAGTGWWEVNTASAIDFAQQGRTVELFDNGDDTLSLLITVLDHSAEPMVPYRSDDGWTPGRLASISRELSANDDRWFDPMLLLGQPEDRNVELLVASPFPLS
ncbi:MAG: TIGR03767 family metallophosphoesterase [Aquihabitans sp.]